MEYSIITCPISGKKLSVNSLEGINTIINYLKKSNLSNKKDEIYKLNIVLENINKNSNISSENTTSLSITNSDISSNIDTNKNEIKKGRFIIIQNADNFEIFTDSDVSRDFYYSSELSDSSSDFSEEYYLNSKDLSEQSLKETKNRVLSKDEIKWGRAPKGYTRKGRFLIKNDTKF